MTGVGCSVSMKLIFFQQSLSIMHPCELNYKLKLQAAMEGTSDPALRQPVASERQGTVSNMHLKKVNIEEYVKVIYMCQTCCPLVVLCP